jgi:hypothetical protein
MTQEEERNLICVYAVRHELERTDDGTVTLNYITENIKSFDSDTLDIICSDIRYILYSRQENSVPHLKERDWLDFEQYLQAEISRRKPWS